jgi:phosphatidylglycerol:prolipoprotein diacylglycerol transferase
VTRARESQLFPLLHTALWGLLGALAGGRLVFVILTWAYFQAHPAEIPQVWLGGLSGPGALAGAALALLLAARFRPGLYSRRLEPLFPLAACLSAAAWLACWGSGDAYGPPSQAFFAVPARDELGSLASRWPLQLLGALLSLAVLWLYERAPRGWPPGLAASLGMAALCLALAGLSFFRVDPAPDWFGLRPDTWGGLALALVFLGLSPNPVTAAVERGLRAGSRPAQAN